MNSSSIWTNEDDEILIDFVRNHEAIYNIKSKQYRKTQLKQNWWREIAEILNKTDSDCSKRWCYIRDYYVRRRGKPGTGSSRETAKKRADLLSFLDSLPSSQKRSITNVEEQNSEDSVSIENINDTTQSSDDETNTLNSEVTQEIEFLICDKSEKKQKHNNTHHNFSQTGLDENDLFFGSMAKIVKKLPHYEQVQLRMQIGSLVGNAELRNIANHSSQRGALNPRPSTSSIVECMERKIEPNLGI